jgi:hypothetical protein
VKLGVILVGMVFAVSLAVVVGNRLSEQALAVTVGVVCGIAASLPVSFGLLIAASRHWGERTPEVAERIERPAAPPPPQVIVVAPPQQNAPFYQYPGMPYLPARTDDGAYNPREFKIVGDE